MATVALCIVGVIAFFIAPLAVIGAAIGWLIGGPVGGLIGGGIGIFVGCD